MGLFRKKNTNSLHTSPSSYAFLAHLPCDQESKKYRDRARDFVKQHIRQRECVKFVQSEVDGKPVPGHDGCGCGRALRDHLPAVADSRPVGSTGAWSPDRNTSQTECNSYGEILFSGFGNEAACAPYCRLESSTPSETLFRLLTDVWGLKAPNLVVSVTGGAKKFYLKHRIKQALQKGFIDITQSTDTWLITGGTGTGVMQYVGESVREYAFTGATQVKHEMTAIGIASWGIIDNSESLTGPKHMGQFPAVYNLQSCTDATKAPLDRNHTHFLLVDDGSDGKYGVEITARADLEEFLSRQTHVSMTSNKPLPTPVVLLVVEGGPNTLEQTRSAVANGIPVVIVDESGRASDIMSAAYAMTSAKKVDGDSSNFPPRFDREMTKIIEEKFGVESSTVHGAKTVQTSLKSLRQILESRHLVTLFAVDEGETKHMDKAILIALLKSKKSSLATQVELSLIWNRSDIARDIIFVPENRFRFQELNLDEALHSALLNNEVEFVKLFLENGVHLNDFLTKRRLYQLYNTGLSDDGAGSAIAIVVQNMLSIGWVGVSYHSRKMNKLPTEDKLLFNVGIAIEYILNEEVELIYPGEYQSSEVSDESAKGDMENLYFHYPERDLFLWAVIFNKDDVAKLLWGRIINPIGGALIASLLLRSLSRKAHRQEEIELSNELDEQSKYYEKLACGVLHECNLMSKPATHDMLTRELERWGNASLICLAGNDGQRMEFMGHGACQSKISRIWKGKMSEFTSDWKVFMTALFPFLLPFTIRFKASEVLDIHRQESTRHIPGQAALAHLRSAISSRQSANYLSQSIRGKTCRIGLCTTRKKIGFIPGYYYFYTAPVTKFTMHALSHLIFLGLFTCIVLTQLQPVGNFDNLVSLLEIIVWVWAGTLLLDEFRQLFSTEHRSLSVKFYVYFSSFWNVLDFLLSVLLIVTVGIRSGISTADQNVARITYSILLMFWYLRFMSYFFLWKSIGPKIFMIRQMLKDLMFFIAILLIFILSFGFPMQALLHPNRPFSAAVVLEAIYSPYFNIFGELLLDRVEGNDDQIDCSSNQTLLAMDPNIHPCAVKTWLVPLMFAIYIMLTNVLLLNLLIAMFSYTFQLVQENSERVWQYYRYGLVYDTYDRPALPPPVIVLAHIYRSAKYVWRKITGRARSNDNEFSQRVSPQLNAKLNILERIGRDNYMMELQQQNLLTPEQQINAAVTKIDQLSHEIDSLSDFLKSRRFVKRWINHVHGIEKNGGPKLFASKFSDVVNQLEENITDNSVDDLS